MSKKEDTSALKVIVTTIAALGGATVVGLAALYYVYRDHAYGTRKRPDLITVPGSKALTGNLSDLAAHLGDRLEFQYGLYKQFGKIIYATVPGRNIIYDFDVNDLQRILSEPYIYAKSEAAMVNARPLLGHGIFSANFDEWRLQRKVACEYLLSCAEESAFTSKNFTILANIFTVNNFKTHFMSGFVEETKLLLSHLQAAGDQGAIIDLQDLLLRGTLDAFCQLGCGKTVDALKMTATIQDGVYTLPNVPFMTVFDSLMTVTIERTFNPIWGITERFNGDSAEIVAEKRANPRDPSKKMDLIDFFLETSNADGTPFSDEYLRDVIINFVVGGRDTTAQTLSWCFWCLSQHPAEYKKLQDEVQAVLGDEEITYEKVKELKYCLACFLETLRIHSNVPVARKQAVQDDVLPSGTKVMKGDYLEYSPWIMGRQTELWGADALEWKPARWIDSSGSVINPSPFVFPNFNAGPRQCLGINMAKQEGVVFLASIVRHFDRFELVNEDDPKKWAVFSDDPFLRRGRYGVAATLSMRSAVHFKLHRKTV
ncbi:hypothetical protein SmJEL517_g02536 [Synchytrium microbalum]|uniref:Cytochrome P450 n=1 Tax=Synchytrium microbalum TaxID=1806994 RepID=A0A507C144_9FUNG|nr:uncharacterized protein SmJEL517_g02536 [Synchytrium microbalum]TPX34817.1 hypothetical protein SmJEL517_g02536 [Synchytrium microbalum]